MWAFLWSRVSERNYGLFMDDTTTTIAGHTLFLLSVHSKATIINYWRVI
jgi:hypothetical protein